MENKKITEAMNRIKQNDLGFLPNDKAKDAFLDVMLYLMLNS